MSVGFSSLTVASTESENCWLNASHYFDIDPWLLYSIAETESDFDPSAINVNRDGSIDIGLMQINTFWFEKIAVFGYQRDDLYDPCINIFVGAWVLSESIKKYGSGWKAIGAYNAGTGEGEGVKNRRYQYAKRVIGIYLNHHRRLGSLVTE